MDGNLNSGIRRFASDILSARRRLVVGASGTAQDVDLAQLFKANDGVAEHYTAITGSTGAVSFVRSGYDDQIDIASNFTTAVTAADLITLENDGVTVRYLGPRLGHTAEYVSYRATNTLPQSTNAAIFTITGRIKLLSILGIVTVAIQAQANNTKMTAVATVGGSTDICSNVDINGAAVGSQFSITGTLATSMQNSLNGVVVYQANPLYIPAGTINLACAASNTGSVKWACIWTPIDPGARVISA